MHNGKAGEWQAKKASPMRSSSSCPREDTHPPRAHDEIMSLISGEWEELFITVGDSDYVVFISDEEVAVTDNIIQVHPEFYR